ncbi:MAG TPA: hypothetical protein VM163_10570 [bacterium]|nr:hypothetical protein [bacterium]
MGAKQYLLSISALLVISSCVMAQDEQVFTFNYSEYVSRLVVDAEGSIWFATCSELMRIRDGELETVYGLDDVLIYAPDVAISPDGAIYIDNCRYRYWPGGGLCLTDYGQLEDDEPHIRAVFDAEGRVFCITFHVRQTYPCPTSSYYYRKVRNPTFWEETATVWELVAGGAPILKSESSGWIMGVPVIVSARECWLGCYESDVGFHLAKLDLDRDETERFRLPPRLSLEDLWAKDSQGRLWMAYCGLGFFDGQEFRLEQPCPWDVCYRTVALDAAGSLWTASLWGNRYPIGITRFRGQDERTYTMEDGLLSNGSIGVRLGSVGYLRDRPLVIDYDGNMWIVSTNEGISMISDGGWPPMRLMLHRLETPAGIAVEAQVINNGPVVGVDVYVALELNGELLFWPNWQPEPYPVQVNLRPGHNQTATIISAPRARIPAGSYTFWGCMTGRNTQKLIGPLDRKFETLRIDVNEGD